MKFLTYFEKYGLFFVLAFCSGLFAPELTPKVSLLELDLSAMSSTKSGSDSFKQIFWLGLFIIYSILFYVNVKKLEYCKALRLINNPLLVFLSIIVICFMSALWSDFFIISVKRTFFQFIFYVVLFQAILLAYINDCLEDIFKWLCISVIAMIFLSVLTGGGINPYYELAGYAKNKNIMGATLAVIFILSFSVFHSMKSLYSNRLLLVIILFLLLLTMSKTSIMLVLIFLALTQMNQMHTKFIVGFASFTCVSIFILLPFISYLLENFWHVGLIIEPETLTGRGLIWDTIYYDMEYFKKLYLGYGYGSYFGVPTTPYFFDDEYSFLRFINSAHNGYIDLLLQFGILSAFLFFVIYKLLISSKNLVVISASIFPILHNVTEPSLIRDQSIVWLMVIFLTVFSCIHSTSKTFAIK